MGTSPDVGGSRGLGRPPNLDYREMEQTATAELNKQQLGQVKNTLEVPFTLLGGNVWKYQAHACKPTLTQTVFEAMVRNDIRETNIQEQKKFKELQEKLPLQLKMGLERSLKMPYEERDPPFIVLHNILRFFAMLLARFEYIATLETNEEKRSHFENLPLYALNRWIEDALEVHTFYNELKEKENALLLSRAINYARGIAKATGETKDSIVQNLGKELDDQLMKIKEGLAPNVLQITCHLLLNLEEIQKSLSSPYPPLYYAIARKEPLGALFGEVLEHYVSLDDTLQDWESYFLKKLIGVALPLGMMATIAASGMKKMQREEDERLEGEAIESLALKLASALTSYSTLLKEGIATLIGPLKLKREKLWVNAILAAVESELPIATLDEESEVKNSLSPLFGYGEELSSSFATIAKETAAPLRVLEIAAKEHSAVALSESIELELSSLEIEFKGLKKESLGRLTAIFGMLDALEEARQQEEIMNVIKQSA